MSDTASTQPSASSKGSETAPTEDARPPGPGSENRASSNLGHGSGERSNLLKLSLAALGIVYGDIGTSPLYAMRECFHAAHGVDPTRASVLGVLSLIFWSLIIIVSVKYIAYVLRADNKGEGGVIALMTDRKRVG
jgi:KUP system potassium uptake protein